MLQIIRDDNSITWSLYVCSIFATISKIKFAVLDQLQSVAVTALS